MTALKDMTGTHWGRLTVIRRGHQRDKNRTMWVCRCECGNRITTDGKSLRRGFTKSCGCLRRELLAQRPRPWAVEARTPATDLPPTALPGQNGRRRPGGAKAADKVIRHLYAIRGPVQTCGHDNPTIAIETEGGEVLSCRRCVLTAVDNRPGVTYLEPLPSDGPEGGDAA